MDQAPISYRALDSRSPEPLEYTAPAFVAPSRPSPLPRNYHSNNYTYGAPSGSLRSTRSNGAQTYSRGELALGARPAQSSLRRGHAFTAENPRQTFDVNNNAYETVSPPPQQQQQQHLRPFVPDTRDRRTPDIYTQTVDYNYRPQKQPAVSGAPLSVPSGPVLTSYPDNEYAPRTSSIRKYKVGNYEDGGAGPSNNIRYARRGSSASSHNGADAILGRTVSPRPTAALGNARLISGHAKTARDSMSPGPRQVSSHRVEFGYTNPAKATLAQSPEHDDDEIADIIADMTKARISPANNAGNAEKAKQHVLLQLGDDVKRAELCEEPSHTLLANLFIEKYQGRLAENSDAVPEIYIRDAKAGIFYELEDMSDVVDGSVLSWRMKPLAEPDSQKEEPIDTAELAKTLATLNEVVSALPAKIKDGLKNELDTAIQKIHEHTSKSIESITAEVRQNSTLATKQSEEIAMEVEGSHKPNQPSITRSTSMPVFDDVYTKKLQQQLQQTQLELSVERQKHQEYAAKLEQEKSDLATELSKLRADVANHPNVLRVRIEEGKLMLKNEYRMHNSAFEDVHGLVQEMRKDVAQRGSIPSTQMMKRANSKLRNIEKGTEKLIKFINETRSDWKRTWEEELQNILKEQGFVKDVEQMLKELLDDTKHLDDVLDKLGKIIEIKLKERSKEDYVPVAATKFIDVVPADDAHDAKKDFLKQIACVDVDHERRIDALKAAERLRQQELATKVNEFDEELSNFVGQRRLRKTGGTEELERRRAEKEIEVMKDMLKSVEEAEQARRAKVAQRKAAKRQAKEKEQPATTTEQQ
ncbi:Bud site selection protein 6 [Coemansia brasiliensis]|uniref:Bud site selection protein 6 n=1 Tax=Coemansia brasiliensis TaxID=2650707 RepID=A0A9W8IFJ4_9FUNG|nr:Bud site selection protein 6 [Coemansia brasiliensis]